jgi:predicted aspartyl protease
MNFAKQIQDSRNHQQLHDYRSTLIPLITCPTCYPPRETTRPFRGFWNFFTANLAAPRAYTRWTQNNFEIVEITRRALGNPITPTTTDPKDIYEEFKNVIKTIYFHQSPVNTLEDLAYFSAVAALITQGFTTPLPPGTLTRLLDGRPPVTTDHPLSTVIATIQLYWATETTSRRTEEVNDEQIEEELQRILAAGGEEAEALRRRILEITEPTFGETSGTTGERISSPVLSEHSPVPSEHSPVPSEHSPVPSEHSPVPSEHSPVPSEHSQTPSERSISPNTEEEEGYVGTLRLFPGNNTTEEEDTDEYLRNFTRNFRHHSSTEEDTIYSAQPTDEEPEDSSDPDSENPSDSETIASESTEDLEYTVESPSSTEETTTEDTESTIIVEQDPYLDEEYVWQQYYQILYGNMAAIPVNNWGPFLYQMRPERSVAKVRIFAGKPEEDVEEWINEFERVAIANHWDNTRKLEVAPAYLQGAAKRWHDRALPNRWTGAHGSFVWSIIERFVTENKKSKWIQQFNNLKQGKKTIDEYNDEFTRLLGKVDPTQAWTDEMIVRKYIAGLKSKLATLVYMTRPTDLDEATEAANRAATGYDISESQEREANLNEQLEQLAAQVAELSVNQIQRENLPPLNQQFERNDRQDNQWNNNNNSNRNNNRNWNQNNDRNWNQNNNRNWNNSGNNRNNNRNWNNNGERNQNNRDNRQIGPCFVCGKRGHLARNCRESPLNKRDQQNNNNRQVNNVEINCGFPFGETLLSQPPIDHYDVVKDVWNAPVNTRVGTLLSNPQYRGQLMTALNTVEDREIFEAEPITTTAAKMKIKINGRVIPATPDSGAALSIISDSLAEQLGLKWDNTKERPVQALSSTTQILGVIEEPKMSIGGAKINIPLRVVKSPRNTLLLGMDWYKKHEATFNTKDNIMEFTSEGTRYQTIIEYDQQINREIMMVEWVMEEEDFGLQD